MNTPNPTADKNEEMLDGPLYKLSEAREWLLLQQTQLKSIFLGKNTHEACWVLVMSGSGYYKKHHQKIPLEPGTILSVLKPDSGALFTNNPNESWILLYLAPTGKPSIDIVRHIINRFGEFQQLPMNCQTAMKALALLDTYQPSATRSPQAVSTLILDWLNTWWEEVECYCKPTSPKISLWKEDPINNLPAGKTVKELARQVGYSRAYLTRKLKNEWGEPPGRVLRKNRLDEAARMLRSTRLKVGNIGKEVGFASPTSFVRAFKKSYGISPLAYRHQFRFEAPVSSESTEPALLSETQEPPSSGISPEPPQTPSV